MGTMRKIGGIPLADVFIERVDCSQNESTLHNVTLMRDIDRYLRLDGRRLLLMSQDESNKVHLVDATDAIGTNKPITESLAFMESVMPNLGMFEMYGTWNDKSDVLIIHVNGADSLFVIVPVEVTAPIRHALVREVKKAIRLAEW